MSILAWIREWMAGGSPPTDKGPPPGMYESPLDKLSNRVLDAIEERDYEKAEKLCRKLLRKYPKMPDGHDRLGYLREAQGRFQDAAAEYSKLLEMLQHSPEGQDQEMIQHFTEKRDEARAKAKG